MQECKKLITEPCKKVLTVQRKNSLLCSVKKCLPRSVKTPYHVVAKSSYHPQEELLALPERVDRLGLDLCRFAVLTPYPGTRQYEEYERAGRILTKDWSRYTQHNAVFCLVNMTPKRLDEIYRQVWKEAYTWKKVLKRMAASPWKKPSYLFILLGANIGFKFLGFDKFHRIDKYHGFDKGKRK